MTGRVPVDVRFLEMTFDRGVLVRDPPWSASSSDGDGGGRIGKPSLFGISVWWASRYIGLDDILPIGRRTPLLMFQRLKRLRPLSGGLQRFLNGGESKC